MQKSRTLIRIVVGAASIAALSFSPAVAGSAAADPSPVEVQMGASKVTLCKVSTADGLVTVRARLLNEKSRLPARAVVTVEDFGDPATRETWSQRSAARTNSARGYVHFLRSEQSDLAIDASIRKNGRLTGRLIAVRDIARCTTT